MAIVPLCFMLMSPWRDVDHSSQLQNTDETDGCCQSLRSDGSQTQLQYITYPTHFAKQTRIMFPCLGFVMSLGFSASGVISHGHSSLASFLPAEQKEEVRHGPWAKRAKPRERKVDNCLFANKSPASERKRGYVAVCWTWLSRLQSKVREREKERRKQCVDFTLSSPWRSIFKVFLLSARAIFSCSSSFCCIAPLIPSGWVVDDSKTTETTEETINEAMIKSSTLLRLAHFYRL